jgi:hypothetical protein
MNEVDEISEKVSCSNAFPAGEVCCSSNVSCCP